MKVKELLKEIEGYKKMFPDFLEWDIYAEQCTEEDKEYKRNEQKWDILVGHDSSSEIEYFDCAGGSGAWKEKKAFCINVNY